MTEWENFGINSVIKSEFMREQEHFCYKAELYKVRGEALPGGSVSSCHVASGSFCSINKGGG